MSIKYEPSKLIKKLRLREKASNVIKDGAINRTAMKALTAFGLLPKDVLEEVALNVIKSHRDKPKEKREAATDKAIRSRVQSAALQEQTKVIQKAYRGEYYRWLKSTAKEPRPEHEKNYGKIFQIGVGDKDGNDPGDLPNCQCGMEILVDDSPEEFNERLEEAL